jgi:hypothetical protein
MKAAATRPRDGEEAVSPLDALHLIHGWGRLPLTVDVGKSDVMN